MLHFNCEKASLQSVAYNADILLAISSFLASTDQLNLISLSERKLLLFTHYNNIIHFIEYIIIIKGEASPSVYANLVNGG